MIVSVFADRLLIFFPATAIFDNAACVFCCVECFYWANGTVKTHIKKIILKYLVNLKLWLEFRNTVLEAWS